MTKRTKIRWRRWWPLIDTALFLVVVATTVLWMVYLVLEAR
jgi:hypothetical protein